MSFTSTGGVSLSCSVAVTVASTYPAAMHWNVADPASLSASSAAASVTICSVAKLPAVKTSAAPPATVRFVSPETRVTATVTDPAGALFSLTPNVARLPSGTATAAGEATTLGGSIQTSMPLNWAVPVVPTAWICRPPLTVTFENTGATARLPPPAAATMSKFVSTGAPSMATLNRRWPAAVKDSSAKCSRTLYCPSGMARLYVTVLP